MDIRGRRQSSNIEDRRGMRPVRTGVGLSIGGVLFLVVLSLLGINPLPFLGVATKAPEVQMQESAQPYQESPQETHLREMTAVVLADTEETWNALLPQYGVQYQEPTLVLFSGAVQSACGTAESAMGPFYCPLDQKVYIDMSFYDDLSQRFGAPGDFAQAYVIAHEVGHHVQNLVGTAEKVQAAQQRMRKARGERSCRCAWNCRRTATPACGPTTPPARASCSSRATSRKAWAPRARSATTGSSGRPRVGSCPTRSRTAARSSACAGSAAGSRPATPRTATRSRRSNCEQGTE